MASNKPSENFGLTERGSGVLGGAIKQPKDGEDDLLYSIISKKKPEEIRQILRENSHPHDIKQLYQPEGSKEVFSLLNYAAQAGESKTVELLLEEAGVTHDNPNVSSLLVLPTKPTPLETAVEFGYIEVAKVLVVKGSPVTAKLFMEVIDKGYEEVATAMFKKHGLELLRNKVKSSKVSTLTCGKEDNTPFRELIRYMPDLAKKVLDKCLVEGNYSDNHNDQLFEVAYNYELIEDFRDYKAPESSERDSSQEYNFFYVTKKDRRNTWGPSRFTKHNHPLAIMVRHKREVLLNHPVVSSLIHYKWSIYGLLSYALNLTFYALFLFFLTSFALVLRSPLAVTCLPGYAVNATICPELSDASRLYPSVAAAFVLVIAITKVFLELFQLLAQKIYYFTDLSNWIEPILFLCSILFTAMPNWACPCVFPWQWQVGAIAICLAWLDFILFTSKIPKIGIYVLMFVEICKTFTKLALLTLLLVVTFGLTFYMIFSDPAVSRSTFGNGFRSLIRTLVMTTGELDYDGIFRLETSDSSNTGPDLAFVYTAYVLWVPFVIIMPVLFANLLTGLAVGDTDKVQKEAEFRQLAQVVDQVLTIEEWLPFLKKWIRQRKTENRRNVVLPNMRQKTLIQKAAHSFKFFGWKGRYETLESVEKVLNQQLGDVDQIKDDLKGIKDQMNALSEQIAAALAQGREIGTQDNVV